MPDLCQLADVKSWLNLNTNGADDLLERLITAVSRDFLREIDRTSDFTPAAAFVDVTTLQAHHLILPRTQSWWKGVGEIRIGMNHWPVVSIESVAIDGTAVPQSADGIADGWYIDLSEEPESRYTLLVIGQYVRCRQSKLTINYHAGYATVPADVEQAVIEWVSYRYRTRDSLGKSSVHMQQGESVQFDKSNMPATVKDVIEFYSRAAGLDF